VHRAEVGPLELERDRADPELVVVAISITVFRVIPGRIDVARSGVKITPSFTTNTFSPEPSATYPSAVSRIASS
jgi:hypothetical protein